jgi:hypothetical protein
MLLVGFKVCFRGFCGEDVFGCSGGLLGGLGFVCLLVFGLWGMGGGGGVGLGGGGGGGLGGGGECVFLSWVIRDVNRKVEG